MPLSREENELLCRIENGAPMGAMLRENFWIPAALSAKLEADGPPLGLRLFGEQFVAFRSTDGRVGVFDELCPHRGASLLLAHNEDNALRCIFHGWKYSVTGETVEVPTEPYNHDAFCKKVPLRHYPAREAAGVVFVWLGQGEPQKFPNFEFTNVPKDQVYVTKQMVNCNWLQDVEGGMDSAHVGILHKSWLGQQGVGALSGADMKPIYEFDERKGGYRYAAIRRLPDGRKYVRVNEYVAPWYCFICPAEREDQDRLVIMSTPVDDTHVIHWIIRYNPFKTLTPSFQNPAEDPDNFPPGTVGGRENRWGQDRGAMKRGHFTGFAHLNTEDFVVAESQGPIANRSREFLNSGDLAVVRLRRILQDLLEDSMKRGAGPTVDHEALGYEKVRAQVYVADNPDVWKIRAA